MSRLYPTIDMLLSHTNLAINKKNNNRIRKVMHLSAKEDKQVWQVLFLGENGLSSAVIKCGRLPQSLVEYEIYGGHLAGLETFLPVTYGQWLQDEWYCIAIENLNMMPYDNFLSMLNSILESVARLHSHFSRFNIGTSVIPCWRELTLNNLDNYFAELEQKVDDARYELPASYKGLIRKGIKILPQLLLQTQDFPQTLIHGDIHRSNTGSSSSKGLVFIDWENAQIAPATFDIVWLIERSLASQLCSTEQAKELRQRWISTYLELLDKNDIYRKKETFLTEYKIAYIYLILTSLIWNYGKHPRNSAALVYHLENFVHWSKELSIF